MDANGSRFWSLQAAAHWPTLGQGGGHAARVKVVVASFMQPLAAYLLSSAPRSPSRVRG